MHSKSAAPVKSPLVSVIIPFYNNIKQLQGCLCALAKQDYPNDRYEVIVVDNGTGGDIGSFTQGFNRIRTVKESRPGSYAARNKGIGISRGEILAFTDADCIPTETWLAKGVANLLKTPHCGIVGGRVKLFFKKERSPNTAELFETLNYFQQKHNVENVNFSVTANLFTFKRVFSDVGHFDERLKSGGDQEWGHRVFSGGYKLHYAEDTIVFHPARYRVGQLCRKIVRLTGGCFEHERQFRTSAQVLANMLRSDVLPPISRIQKVWSLGNSCPFNQKLKLTGLTLFLKYVALWEKLRLQLGAESQRS